MSCHGSPLDRLAFNVDHQPKIAFSSLLKRSCVPHTEMFTLVIPVLALWVVDFSHRDLSNCLDVPKIAVVGHFDGNLGHQNHE